MAVCKSTREKPEMHFRRDPAARYDRVDEVLALPRNAGQPALALAAMSVSKTASELQKIDGQVTAFQLWPR
jgi:biopolymer transport protein ExbD